MRKILIAGLLALALASPSLSQVSGGAISDAQENRTLDLSTADATSVMAIGNGQGVVAVDITGLTGSGATVAVERTVGGVWSPRNLLVTGSGGAFANAITQDASFTVNTVGSRAIRFRVTVAGAGTARIYASATQNSSVIQFGTSLPAGNLKLGGVDVLTLPPISIAAAVPLQIANFPTSFAVSNFPASQAVTGTVSIAGTVPVSGTFWQATQPVSLAAAVTIVDANGGSLNTAETATNDATAALNPVTALNATGVLVATGARNVYSASVSAGNTGGFLLVANLAAVPASGTALTANGTLLKCIPAIANIMTSFEPRVPIRASAGLVVLFSQGCTPYTPVQNVAVAIDGRAL